MQSNPVRVWYRHPRAIRDSNWRSYGWLVLTALIFNAFLPAIFSRDDAGRFILLSIALLLLLPVGIALARNLRHTFRQPDTPLVATDADGIHFALADPRHKNLYLIPLRGAQLGSGAANCHIPWDKLGDIEAIPLNFFRRERLRLSSRNNRHHANIYTARLGDYESVCAIADSANALCHGQPLPPDDALPPLRVRPFGWGLLAANTALLILWVAYYQLASTGLVATPPGNYPFMTALAVLTALNLAARLAPWQLQAELQDDGNSDDRKAVTRL